MPASAGPASCVAAIDIPRRAFAPCSRCALTVIGVIGGVALVWRELTTDHPVVDFRVLRHRQMWVGTVLGVVMGIGLYAMSFTLPVFLQGNLRMTAEQTGLVLLPGAIATAISMAVVGRLTNRVDPRLLIASAMLLPYRRALGTTGFILAAALVVYMLAAILVSDRRRDRG